MTVILQMEFLLYILFCSILFLYSSWEQNADLYVSLYTEHSLAASSSPQLSTVVSIHRCCTVCLSLWAGSSPWLCMQGLVRAVGSQPDRPVNQNNELKSGWGLHRAAGWDATTSLSPCRESFDSKLISAMSLNGDWSLSAGRFYSWSGQVQKAKHCLIVWFSLKKIKIVFFTVCQM